MFWKINKQTTVWLFSDNRNCRGSIKATKESSAKLQCLTIFESWPICTSKSIQAAWFALTYHVWSCQFISMFVYKLTYFIFYYPFLITLKLSSYWWKTNLIFNFVSTCLRSQFFQRISFLFMSFCIFLVSQPLPYLTKFSR